VTDRPRPTLGFIGTGTIAAAIVEGLAASGDEDIIVSPRNAQVAAALAARFPRVRIAASNQEVLDASTMALLSVRPQVADTILRELRFRADHHVVSLIATVSIAYLRTATAPAATVVRAVPLPPVAHRQGPTALFPPDDRARALFDRLGKAIEIGDESEFEIFTSATAVMASHFAFARTVTDWMGRQGVAPRLAHAYMAQMLRGLGEAAPAAPEASFADLAAEYQTPGGINEQIFRAMTVDGIIPDLDRALGDVLARLRKAHD